MSGFKPGQSGNPAGRPRGVRNKRTVKVEEMMGDQVEGLTQKAISMALEGDTTALRLCLERIAPARKDAPINFEAPKLESASDAAHALAAVLEATARGELTPVEATSVAGLIERFCKSLEVEDLERRITELEKSK